MDKRTLLAALLWIAAAALAQDAPPAGQGASFICGGISQPEAQAMKARAPGHDLMLTFAETKGAYLADVGVKISDRRGHVVLSATCDGPIMLVDLPSSGTWHVAAEVNGVARQATISTTHGHTARATMLWPASE